MPEIPPEHLLDVTREVSEAAGWFGMVAGQVLDVRSEGKTVDLKTLQQIHRLKTGAMITVSLRTGAILGGALLRRWRRFRTMAGRSVLPSRSPTTS